MVYGNFVYTTDAGAVVQVTIPADFALALLQVPATIQPTLDNTIAPRFATFKSATGLIRQAVIDTVTNFAPIIGSTVTVGGVMYTCTGATAESTPPYVPNTILNGAYLIQGPQGVPGTSPPGAFPCPVRQLNADTALTMTDQNSYIGVSAQLGPVTITLPDPATLTTGNFLAIAKQDASANAVTIANYSYEWIVFGGNYVINTYGGGVFIIWAGGQVWGTVARWN